MDAAQKERREREIAEILMRFRTFAERSKWKKAESLESLVYPFQRSTDGSPAMIKSCSLRCSRSGGFWRSGSKGRLCFWRRSAGQIRGKPNTRVTGRKVSGCREGLGRCRFRRNDESRSRGHRLVGHWPDCHTENGLISYRQTEKPQLRATSGRSVYER